MLDQGIDTSTAVGWMFFQILGAIAEFEHALISEHTRDGLEAARPTIYCHLDRLDQFDAQ